MEEDSAFLRKGIPTPATWMNLEDISTNTVGVHLREALEE